MKRIIAWLAICIVSVSIASSTTFHVPYFFSDDDSIAWWQLETKLLNTSGDIILLWEGQGGYTRLADKFNDVIDKLVNRGQKVEFLVIGNAISNHADSICHGTSIVMTNNAFIVFHPEYDEGLSKKYHHKVYSGNKQGFLKCITTGFVTDKEIDKIMRDHLRLELTPDGKRIMRSDWTDY